MGIDDIDFSGFNGRDSALKRQERWYLYSPMFYRTDLWIHTRRVRWIFEEMKPLLREVYGEGFDYRKAEILTFIHDDIEILTGDPALSLKNGRTEEQKKEDRKKDIKAARILAKIYPDEIEGYNYEQLLRHSIDKDCLEAQVVSLCDKLDGFGEALHELYTGNEIFAFPVHSYIHILSRFGEKFEGLVPLLTTDKGFVVPPNQMSGDDIIDLVWDNSKYAQLDITEDTGHHHYDMWRRTNVKYADDKELQYLKTKKEKRKVQRQLGSVTNSIFVYVKYCLSLR